MNDLIYYLSKGFIDQLYRKNYGSVAKERTLINENEKAGIISAEFSIGQLLSIISLKGAANVSKKKNTKNQTVLSEHVEDRANLLINSLFANDEIKDVKDIKLYKNNSLYRFNNFKLLLNQKFSNNGNDTIIDVSHNSDEIEVIGRTSASNWVTESLLTGLLFAQEIEVSGILTPLSISEINNKLKIIAQFILIAQPYSNEE